MLTIERAKELNAEMVTEDHLIRHCTNVMAAMGAMAEHFGEDPEYWKAIGYLHDYDYEKYPDEHLQHTEEPLREAGVDEADIRAILSHGYGHCTDVEPQTDMEKSLYTVDELLAKSPLLADFKAVRDGAVWCTGKNLFQEPMGLGKLIVEFHQVLTGNVPADGELDYLHRLT